MPAPVIAAIIAGGAGVAGSAIASHGNTSAAKTNADASDKAAQIQADTAAKALAQAKDIYQQQRADEGPYREGGYNSLNALNYGLGLPAVNYQAPTPSTPAATDTTTAPTHTTKGGEVLPDRTRPPGTPSTGTAVPRDAYTANTLNAVGGGTSATTRVKAPNGQTYMIPNGDVPAALQAGGSVVA